jgi:diguanylate cyclase (GGDEF)-like protein
LLYRERLQKKMDERQRDGKILAVMMIDLDRFKIVNDTLDQQAGDLLLQNVAHAFKECGGDELIVFLSEIA